MIPGYTTAGKIKWGNCRCNEVAGLGAWDVARIPGLRVRVQDMRVQGSGFREGCALRVSVIGSAGLFDLLVAGKELNVVYAGWLRRFRGCILFSTLLVQLAVHPNPLTPRS